MGREAMRAGDGDRALVAERLRAALDEGRLDLHEYDERLQRAYAAKTYGDLDTLLADLPTVVPAQRAQVAPVAGPAASPAPAPPPAAPDATRRWLAAVWGSYLMTAGITTVIWLLTVIGSRHLNYFWPGWVIGPWGVLLAYQTIMGLQRGEPQRAAARRERKRVARQAKRQRRELRRR